MLFFRNDYGQGCIQPIMTLLEQANEESSPGYGEDVYCKKAAALLQSKLPDVPSDIHFIVSGTLTNIVMIRHVLKPYEAVICCDTAHIAQHEAGAIEAAGHKLILVANSNGKVTPSQIRKVCGAFTEDSHYYMRPRLVYISNATELGTVYTRSEMEQLHAVCQEFNLLLMVDGARMGQALMSGIDYSLNDIAKWCDIFSVGGTKNGALFGEAVVIPNAELKPYFRYVQKQSGAIIAKGWLIGMQFIGLFENDDFYRCAKHANDMAAQVQSKIIELEYPLFMKSCTNQIFVVLSARQHEYITSRVSCEVWETWDDSIVVRLVTSWHTTQQEVDDLCEVLEQAARLDRPEEEPEEEPEAEQTAAEEAEAAQAAQADASAT